MSEDRPIVRFLRHPAYLPTVGILLLLYGMVCGSISAFLGAGCCLYLAWHVSRQRALPSTGDHAADRYPSTMRRVVQAALLIGLAWGGVQAYFRLVELGWERWVAVVALGTIVGSVGGALWAVGRSLLHGRP
jgi:hypothetical protein